MHFSQALAKRGIVSLSLHPGVIPGTSLGSPARNPDDPERKARNERDRMNNVKHKTASEGASTTLVAALDPKAAEHSGGYMADCQIAEPGKGAKREGAAEELWKLSERLVGETFAF